ncbi:MAG: hypothetical protein CK424_00715 [Legionella sp.]|nr:MAG: hypothetical protein CK424_00715 [Legionella sp.]
MINVWPEIMTQEVGMKYHIAIVGPAAVGKNEIVKQFLKEPFEAEYNQSIGTEIKVKEYKKTENDSIPVQYSIISPRTTAIAARSSIEKSHKICVVFDVTDKMWQQTVEDTLNKYKEYIPEATQIIIIGTKSDDADTPSKIYLKAQQYARKHSYAHAEVSSLSAKGFDILEDQLINGFTSISYVDQSTIKAPDAIQRTRKLRNRRLSSGSMSINSDIFKEFDQISSEALNDNVEFQEEVALSTSPARNKVQAYIQPINGSRKSKQAGESDFSEDESVHGTVIPSTPTASSTLVRQQAPQPPTYLSTALRLAAIAIMLAGLVSIIYFIMLAASTIGTPVLTAMMEHLVGTAGGLFGVSAATSIATFSNTCISIGISAENATAALGVIHGVAMISGGYGLFSRATKPSDPVEPALMPAASF